MTAGIALVIRMLLAAIFGTAAIAKLSDRTGTRTAVVEFGAPARLATPLALAIPFAELATAGLLLPATTATAGAVLALWLLLLFSGAIALSIARGRAPDCHCFGQLHSAPASWKTLVRNGVLLGATVIALVGSLAGPAPSAVAWIGRLDRVEAIALAAGASAAVLLIVGALTLLTLLRSYGQVLVRLDRVETALAEAGIDVEEPVEMPEIGLTPGTSAPAFTATSVTGKTVSLDDLLTPGLPLLLLFTSPTCGPCASLLPTAAAWQTEHADALTIAFASDGSTAAVRAEAEELELANVLVDADRRLYETYEASGTPTAVLIAADGTIGTWVATGSEWIERLVEQAVHQPEESHGLPVGTEPPALALRSLAGGPVELVEFEGRDTLLLFWNPSCGYCQSMRDDLLAWEQTANGVTPQLVVVSSGDEEATRADGFASTVLLDDDFAAGSAFGANGTPMAVLLGPDGRVASGVVAGADAVLALARHSHD